MKVNEVNFRKWIAEMRMTDKPQGQEHLCSFLEGMSVGYCCLGLGSLLVPGLEVNWYPVESWDDSDSPSEPGDGAASFGESRATDLAGVEFVRWLLPDFDPLSTGKDEGAEFDLVPDYPQDMVLAEDINGSVRDARGYACASHLNDGGLTFDQIADVFEYFGIGGVV